MAKFSKQHYQVIAGILSTYLDERLTNTNSAREILLRVAEQFAHAFECDNSRFNREHFLAVVRGERPVNSRPPRS